MMPPSPIRKLVPFAEKAKAQGIKVHHLNIGQPDIETPAEVMNAVKNADIKVLAYSHSAGNESYRKKLVEYYSKNGIDINAERNITENYSEQYDAVGGNYQSRAPFSTGNFSISTVMIKTAFKASDENEFEITEENCGITPVVKCI